MGAVIFSKQDYFDSIIDITAIKTGLVLSKHEIVEFLNQEFFESNLTTENLDHLIRIRAENIEDQIRFLRIKLGNLSAERRNPYYAHEILWSYLLKGDDPIPTINLVVELLKDPIYQNNYVSLILEVKRRKKRASQKLIIDVLYFLAESQNDDIYNMNSNREICNEGVLLSDIFNCEIKGNGNDFLEQNVINYLAANLEDLEKMHWRNFERFCAEYFQRLGYEVKLGTGRNDGGVDIRLYDITDPTKPLILIQCKRHSTSNTVKIDTVKAFYSDVSFEKAKSGMIVTTSTIEPDGKKVSTARNYPLSFAENAEVKDWALNMWIKNQ